MKQLARAFVCIERYDTTALKTGLRFGVILVASLFFSDAVLTAQTNLGSVAIGSSASATVTLTLSASGTIVAPVVMTQGATGLDFTDAGTGTCTTNGTSYSYSSGATCTVAVNFSPKYPGQRLGGVQLLSSTGSVAATAAIYGIGVGPQITYSPGIRRTLVSNLNGYGKIAVDSLGNVYVMDSVGLEEIIAVGGVIPPNPTRRTLMPSNGLRSGLGSFALDGSGNIYIVTLTQLLEIEAVGGVIPSNPTILTLHSGFWSASEVAVDGRGNVYVADAGAVGRDFYCYYSGIYEFLSVDGVMPINPNYRLLGGIGGTLSCPVNLAVDGNGDIFFTTYEDNGPYYSNEFFEVLAVDGVIPDNPTIRKMNTLITVTMFANLAVDSNGNLYVIDALSDALNEIEAVGGVIPDYPTSRIVASGIGGYYFTVDGNGNFYVFNSGAVVELNYSTPPTMNFPTPTNVGSADITDGAQTVTITNNGNASLNFTIPSSGNNPSIASGFAYDATSTCPQLSPGSSAYSLAAGAYCNFAVDFIPIAAGTNTGSLILTDNSLNVTNAAQTVSLNGNGNGALTSTTSLTSSATNVVPNQPLTLTATVAGSGATPTGTVTFSSTSTGLNQGVLGTATLVNGVATYYGLVWVGVDSITASYSGDANYSVSTSNAVAVTNAPVSGKIVFNWPYLDWAQPVAYGASTTPWPVTLTNLTGSSIASPTLSTSGTIATNLQFSGNTCGTLAQGASCTFSVSFAPTSGGSPTGTKQTGTLTATASGYTATLPVSGIAVSSSLSFNWPFLNFTPTVAVGSTAPAWPVTMTNQSGTSTTVDSINFSDASFTLTKDNCTGQALAAGASCTFSVLFSPILADITHGGTNIISGTMTASGNSGAVTGALTVGGWGGAGGFAINWNQDQQAGVSTIDFGPHNTSNVTSGPWPIIVYNYTPTEETLTLAPSLGVFTTGQSTCGIVYPGSSCTFNLYFTPTAVQHYKGTLTITGDQSGSYIFNTWGEAIQ